MNNLIFCLLHSVTKHELNGLYFSYRLQGLVETLQSELDISIV